MKPRSMPIPWCKTYATGARQLVVHEAFEMTVCLADSSSWLTPMTTVKSAPSAGAEMITFLAPASRCFAACSRFVKMPVHSSATSTPNSFHGSLAGSRSAVTRILPWPASIQFSPVVTSPAKRPRSEEHTSELQSRLHLVCRLLLEKKKKETVPLLNYKKKQPRKPT